MASARAARWGFLAAQFFYGGWFLFHGLNWWLRYFPEKSFGPNAHGLIPELIHTGLFDLVKVMEVVIGLALLANLFVPLAIVVAVPITVVTAWVNAAHGSAFGVSVAAVILSLNGFMALGQIDRYRPMLAMRAGQPGPSGATRDLPAGRHLAAVLLGIAAAAAITYASIQLSARHPAAQALAASAMKARP